MTIRDTEDSIQALVWFTLSCREYTGTYSASEELLRWHRIDTGTTWLTIWEDEA